MKNASLSILFIFLLCNSFAQARKDTELSAVGKQIGILTSAVGWCQQDYGKWVSRVNRIPWRLEKQFQTLHDYQKYSLGIDNFIFFQLCKTPIDSNCYIFTKRNKDGYYRYETIEEGWILTQKIESYLIDRKNFDTSFVNLDTGWNDIYIPYRRSANIFLVN